MRKILAALLFVVSAFSHAEIVTIPIPGGSGLSVTVGTGANALPLQDIRTNPNAVNITTYDDSYNQVPLGFDFPFYGRMFNNSWAMTNGLVTFQDPAVSGLGGACCQGVNLTTERNSAYNYTIYGMHTDLYSWNGQNQYYLRGTNEMTYGWYNLSQCCSGQGGNSFEIKINSAGLVDTRIAGAMVNYNAVTSGMAGNLANGEYFQAYHGQGMNITPGSAGIFSWQAPYGTGAIDMCYINPLSSPTCPGYQTAYNTQQCTISALWDPSCPGYQTAYFTQQCSLDALYNSQCPGYQAAYLQQQCSVNPLYSTTCSGYQRAYHDQQCSLNTLAYTDCPGYAAAYLQQQCSANPLYSTTCSGYAEAYKAQQCALDGLYDRTCPNYSTAYATKMLLEQQGTASIVATAGVIAATAPATSTTSSTTAPTTSSDGTTRVALVSDNNVNNVITNTSTSTAPTAPAAPVQLSAPAPQQNSPMAPAAVAQNQQQDRKTEERKNDSPSNSAPAPSSAGNNSSDDKSSNQPKTARQELQERRESAAKAKAVETGKNLGETMGKAASMEQQTQVQNVVIAAMGYSPAFDAYKVMMPDVPGYKPYSIYKNQTNVDNRRLGYGLFGATDKLHSDMVNSQYNKGN